jgi:hypothetical protein
MRVGEAMTSSSTTPFRVTVGSSGRFPPSIVISPSSVAKSVAALRISGRREESFQRPYSSSANVPARKTPICSRVTDPSGQ